MHSRLFSSFTAVAAAFMLSSCAATRFWGEVNSGGKIVGRPCIDWMKPDKFVYNHQKNPDFKFVRHNGDVIIPESIETDGGSIPRLLWAQDGYSPWTYAPAYLVHDWLYEAHRRGVPAARRADGTKIKYDKQQADWIMAEIIKTQMEQPDYATPMAPDRMRKIYWAVSKFGDSAWNGKPRPLTPAELGTLPFRIVDKLVDETLNALPLSPVFESMKAQVTPVPGKPEQEGTVATPQEASKGEREKARKEASGTKTTHPAEP